MEEVKHEEEELNNDKQLFLRQFKRLKEQSQSVADHHTKKREYDTITPTVQLQNNADNKFAPTAKAQH